jgi:hypothetical protein
MSVAHKIYIFCLTLIVLLALISLIYIGFTYYSLPLEERFFHEGHAPLKPGGVLGHGYGIAGALAMIFGILLYVARKNLRILSRWGVLKHWLEFHIFLCTLGPILVLFHTSFKFGGIVAVSFWSMVAVFLSGIIGRFIYIQIPRTIEGRELSLNEIQEMKSDIGKILNENYSLDEESYQLIMDDNRTIRKVRVALKRNKLARSEYIKVMKLVKQDISLNRRIERLVTMQKLFRYWHVIHMPFALVMLIIMVIHVAVTIVFGYRWIF